MTEEGRRRPALEVVDLCAGYGRSLTLHGIDLAVARGRVLGIFGPNGSGKSTLAKTIAGLLPVVRGALAVEGREVTRLQGHERTRAGISYVPQERNVFATLSVEDNLRLATEFILGAERAGDYGQALEIFPALRPRLKTPAGALSGGERQMLAFASALLPQPVVLVVDEPTAGLSPAAAQVILAQITRVSALDIAVVLVEQNVEAALGVVDEVAFLSGGLVEFSGPAASVSAREDFARFLAGGAP